MIIYTPLSMQEVFPQSEGIEQQYVETGTGMVMIEKDVGGTWVVGRLISANPDDYLEPKYQPGTPWSSGDDQQ